MHQLIVHAVFLLCALASSALLLPLMLPRLGQFLHAGVVYTLLVFMMILLVPKLVGSQRGEIQVIVRNALYGQK